MAFKKIKVFIEQNQLDSSKAYDVCVDSKQPSFAAVNAVPHICGTCSDEVDAKHAHDAHEEEVVVEEPAPAVVVEESTPAEAEKAAEEVVETPELPVEKVEEETPAEVVEEAKPAPKSSKKKNKSAKAE